MKEIFLHVSKKEQKKGFLERVENPDKNRKVSATDLKERQFQDPSMEAYEERIRSTATGAGNQPVPNLPG